jgi:2-C-methyl-D-erythritol 4-phosphate cytidylyltransferase
MKTKANKVVAIVPAAGLGKRFGQEKNKPLHPLLEKPLIIWTLEILQGLEEITEIIPVLKEEDLVSGGEMINEYDIKKIRRIVPGGKERQDSVYNAIKILDEDTSVVLVHDGARPFIEAGLIKRMLRELRDFDGVIAGVPVKDTIKECRINEAEDVVVSQTLQREFLWAIQTPQVFDFRKIKDAYEKAVSEKYYATDDAALIERYGGNVRVTMGSYKNIKITTPEDIFIAEALLKA